MIPTEALRTELQAHTLVLHQTAEQCSSAIVQIALEILQCFERGNKLMLCGNGGSAADAQHVAAEFINRFRLDRPPLPALALTTDQSVVTSIGNDSDFACIFSQQVEALAQPGDILAAISTSGGSVNVLKALDAAKMNSVLTVGFTGERGREIMAAKCDYCLIVPSSDTARIQECHEFVWHVICGIVEEKIFLSKSHS